MKDAPKFSDTLPPLVVRVSAIMGDVAGRMAADPDVTKTLRTMAVSAKPIAYWRLAQAFPSEISGGAACDVILRGLGSIGHVTGSKPTNGGNGGEKGPGGFGAVLARADFPESRMDRLVASSGPTLCGLAAEALRFATSKGVARADWRSLAGLLIADEMSDYDAAQWCQRKLALEFVRVPAGSKAA